MAFVIGNKQGPATRNSDGNAPVLEQWIRVSRATDTLPQTGGTNEDIFNVEGGRILLKAIVGEVTTAISGGTTPDLALGIDDDAGLGDTEFATDVAITADGVGTLYSAEGDGTALIAGGFAVGTNGNGMIVPPGTIYWDCSESSISGSVKWDLYYLPLDPAAYVTIVAV